MAIMNPMNPFTKFLKQWTNDQPDLAEFIEHWDNLEALSIAVYKAAGASAEDEQIYQQIKAFMDGNYHNFAGRLKPFWQDSEVGGQLDHADPFKFLFQYDGANGFVDNWAALQHLPAAREALNGLLVQMGQQ